MLWPLLGGSCPVGWDYYNENCYYASAIQSWLGTARSECQAMDADLVSISNDAEMDFVESISWELTFYADIIQRDMATIIIMMMQFDDDDDDDDDDKMMLKFV